MILAHLRTIYWIVDNLNMFSSDQRTREKNHVLAMEGQPYIVVIKVDSVPDRPLCLNLGPVTFRFYILTFLSLSFLICKMGSSSHCLIGLLRRLDRIMHIRNFVQCLTCHKLLE